MNVSRFIQDLELLAKTERYKAIADAVMRGDISSRKLFDAVLNAFTIWDEDEYDILQHITSFSILFTLYQAGTLADDRVKHFSRRAAELTETNDHVCEGLKKLAAGEMQFAYLCYLQRQGNLWRFIQNKENYRAIYKLIEPEWRDRVVGVSLNYTKNNPVFDYTSPDVTGQRFWYVRFIIVNGSVMGLLPRAVKSPQQLTTLLSYIPLSLFRNYVHWHDSYFVNAVALETILLGLNYARACEIIRCLEWRHLNMAYASDMIVERFGKEIEAKKGQILVKHYQQLKLEQSKKQSKLSMLAVTNLFAKHQKVEESEVNSQIAKEANEVSNACEIALWLIDHDASQQYAFLQMIGAALMQITTVEDYGLVRESLADGDALDIVYLRCAETPQELARSFQFICSFSDDIIVWGNKYMPVTSLLKTEITDALAKTETVEKFAALMQAVQPMVRGMLLHYFATRLFPLVQTREDYQTLHQLLGEPFKHMMQKQVAGIQQLAKLYSLLPLTDVKQTLTTENGTHHFPKKWADWLRCKENLIYFLRRQTPQRCYAFMEAMQGFIVTEYNDFKFYDVCKAVCKEKGYLLYNYFTSLSRPAPSLLLTVSQMLRGRPKPDKEALKPKP